MIIRFDLSKFCFAPPNFEQFWIWFIVLFIPFYECLGRSLCRLQRCLLYICPVVCSPGAVQGSVHRGASREHPLVWPLYLDRKPPTGCYSRQLWTLVPHIVDKSTGFGFGQSCRVRELVLSTHVIPYRKSSAGQKLLKLSFNFNTIFTYLENIVKPNQDLTLRWSNTIKKLLKKIPILSKK